MTPTREITERLADYIDALELNPVTLTDQQRETVRAMAGIAKQEFDVHSFAWAIVTNACEARRAARKAVETMRLAFLPA